MKVPHNGREGAALRVLSFGKRSRSRVSELKERCQRKAKVKQPSKGENDEAGREKKREASTGFTKF